MGVRMGFREEVINIELARMFCKKGLKAIPENIIGNKKMPDILILVDGVKLVLEGKFGNKNRLHNQAKERIKGGLCEISIAIVYEEDLKNCVDLEELHCALNDYRYNGVIFYQDECGIKEIIFNDVDLNNIVEILNQTTKIIINSDVLRNIVNNVEEVFDLLVSFAFKSNVNIDDMVILNNLKDLLAIDDVSKLYEKYKKDVLRIAFFVLLDAMIFQEELCNLNSKIKSLTYAYRPYKNYFEEVWCEVLKIDYKSIFEIALQVLRALPNGSHDTEEILGTIKDLSLKIINSGLLVKHDFMGRIYHRLLLKTTGQYYATYYTAVPSAYLLSNLLFKCPNSAWSFDELDFLRNFKVVDPSCGSGTLLSASYNALKYIYLSILSLNEFKNFHRIIIEDTIHGWDVLSYATHLTLTVLCLHNPKVLINRSNILKLPNGIDSKGNTYLGSISLMDPHFVFIDDKLNDPIEINGIEQKVESYLPYKIKEEKFDVVIMNPPFSRSAKPNTKFGYSDSIIKEQMGKELNKIIERNELKGIGQAGLGAVFIALAKDMIRMNGRIGIVIPRAILTGVSWSKIRNILYEDFEIKYIVSNYDTGDKQNGIEPWNWSEDTALGEVMIIAEKNCKSIEKKETIYVSLWNKPENEIDSICYVQQILGKDLNDYIDNGCYQVIASRDKEVGAFYKIKQEEIKNNWLIPCLFSSPILNTLSLKLPQMFPVTRLSNLLEDDGVDIKQIKDTFKKTNINTDNKIVWGQQSSMNKLFLEGKQIGNGYAVKNNAKKISEKASSFLLSERPHLANDCIIAMRTPYRVLATAFWELKFNDPSIEALMALWLNSTPGLIMYLSSSTNSMGEIFKTKKQQLNMMNVLNPSMCSKEFINKAVLLYDEIKNNELQKFELEFKLASIGKGIRYKIDSFIIKELGINLDLSHYYKMLMNEPIITKKRLVCKR